MVETASPNSTPLLRRARVACKACNARRVKCDAAEGQPCWHCRTRQTPCELIESRRGKYTRNRQGPQQNKRASRRSYRFGNGPDFSVQASSPAAALDTGRNSPLHPANDDAAEAISATQGSQEEGTRSSATREGGLRLAQEIQTSQMNTVPRPKNPGDSSNISYIIEVVYCPKGGSTEPMKVHYRIPASIADRPPPAHGPHIDELVSLREALEMPPKDIADRLIRTFFEIIHPAYPVFDRKRFTQLYLQNLASPLILQTIFLLGFTVGSDELAHAAGYSDRFTAKKAHYQRAKALYDADYENDLTIVAAVLLLLGFWWSGPEDQKDSCYWVGCATTLAQSLGMHRSPAHSAMSPSVRSLRKRIWWSIYIRDRHTSAAFGRPCRIRDEDCDIEPLTEEDLNFDNDFDLSLIPPQKDFHISYVFEMSKLALILGDILVGEFSPRRAALEKYDTQSLAQRLLQWDAHLPTHLRRMTPDESLTAPFWACILEFSYQYCQILLFRPKAIENLSPAEAERDCRARMAADAITRLAEDLLAVGTLRLGQIHLVPALFGALSVHTIVICRKDPVRRQLAENKSRQCMLALSELANPWPVKIWIAKAFVNLLRRLTGQGSASGGSILNVSTSIASNRSNLALSGHWGLLALQQPHSPKENHSRTNDGDSTAQNLIDRDDASIQAAYINESQPRELHAPDCFLQAADQFICDSFWAGYLDNTFDVDLLLRNGLGPTMPGSYEGMDGNGQSSAPGM